MRQNTERLPLLSLQNQYTYLKGEKKKDSALFGFSKQLSSMKKLPTIDKKYIKTTRKVQKQLFEIQQAIQNRKKIRNLQSQHRYLNPSMVPIYMPMPTMPIGMPANMQMSMFLPQVQTLPINSLLNNGMIKSQVQPKQQKNQQQKNQQQMPQKPQQQKNQLNQKKLKQINKFKQKSKINRFRVIGYVVYFSIYIKYFSRKFTELRKNWFNQRYAANDGKIILESSAKILRNLYQIDIYKMIQTSKQKVKDIDLQQLNYLKSANGKTTDPVLSLIHFITLIVDYAREYMTAPNFIQEHHQVFTVGLLTQNFMISNLYLPQQAALLHIHPAGYIQVEQQTQVILLMLKIVVKILVYNFLLGLKYSRQWNTKQEKSHGLDDADMDQIWMLTRHAGIFLCIVCEQIYDKTFKQMSNSVFPYNFNQMSPKFNILPAKSLQQAKRIKAVPNQRDNQSKLITNLQGYGDMQALIAAHPPLRKFKDKIKLKIIDFLTTIYTQLKYQEAKVYDFIWQMTLGEKYIIMKGVKEDILNKKKKKKGNLKKKNSLNGGTNKQGGGNRDQNDSKHKAGQNGNGLDGGDQNQDNDDQDDSNQDEGEGKKRKKKMRFKHEQAFFDHKFDGHHKLEKLKQKMKKKV